MLVYVIVTLSLHYALPIFRCVSAHVCYRCGDCRIWRTASPKLAKNWSLDANRGSSVSAKRPGLVKKMVRDSILESKRSEEHTSELQSQSELVSRILLEKKQ